MPSSSRTTTRASSSTSIDRRAQRGQCDERRSQGETVQRLIDRLQRELGEGGIVFIPNWDDETDAFGVAHPQARERRAYVCSYPDGVFVSLEIVEDGSDEAPEAGSFHDLSDSEVVTVVQRHLHDR